METSEEGGGEEDQDDEEIITKADLSREESVRYNRIQKKLGDLLIDLRTDHEMGDLDVNPDNHIAQMIKDGEDDEDIISQMKSLGSDEYDYEDDGRDEDDDSYGPDDDEENPNGDDFSIGRFLGGESFKMKLDKIKSRILKETSQHQKIV